MAEWLGEVDYVSDGTGGPEVHITLTRYELSEGEEDAPPVEAAPLPRVGQSFRLVRDESESGW